MTTRSPQPGPPDRPGPPDLVVPERFRSTGGAAHCGWAAGALARYLAPGAVAVDLRAVLPLDEPVQVRVDERRDGADGGRATAWDGDRLLMEATHWERPLETLAPVDPALARTAARAGVVPGPALHPVPVCFCCGCDRSAADGLRIHPGHVPGSARGLVATTWTPHASTGATGASTATLPVTWAAIDCVGAWAGTLSDRLLVHQRLVVEVLDLPRLGEEHVVVAAVQGTLGDRVHTVAALHDVQGRLLARAEHLWRDVLHHDDHLLRAGAGPS